MSSHPGRRILRRGAAIAAAAAGVATSLVLLLKTVEQRPVRAVAPGVDGNPPVLQQQAQVAEPRRSHFPPLPGLDRRFGVTEGLSAEEVGRVVRKHRAQLVRCFERELLDDPNAIPMGTLELEILPDGRVSHPQVVDTHLSERYAACVEAEASRWSFPPTTNGKTVLARHWLHFQMAR